MTIWSKQFWKGAADRAIKTFFQTFVAVVAFGVGADAIGATAGLADVSWGDALSVAALATILSVATAVGNSGRTVEDSEPVVAPPRHANGIGGARAPEQGE